MAVNMFVVSAAPFPFVANPNSIAVRGWATFIYNIGRAFAYHKATLHCASGQH
jgi:hypothetical protein